MHTEKLTGSRFKSLGYIKKLLQLFWGMQRVVATIISHPFTLPAFQRTDGSLNGLDNTVTHDGFFVR